MSVIMSSRKNHRSGESDQVEFEEEEDEGEGDPEEGINEPEMNVGEGVTDHADISVKYCDSDSPLAHDDISGYNRTKMTQSDHCEGRDEVESDGDKDEGEDLEEGTDECKVNISGEVTHSDARSSKSSHSGSPNAHRESSGGIHPKATKNSNRRLSNFDPHFELDYDEDSDVDMKKTRSTRKVDSDEGEISSGEEGEIVNKPHQAHWGKSYSPPRMDTSICRHYIAGTCDWGRSCRFRHPAADELVELKEKGLLPDSRHRRNESREGWSELRGSASQHAVPPYGHFGMGPGMGPGVYPPDFAGFHGPRHPYPPHPPYRPPGWTGYGTDLTGGVQEESDGWIRLKMPVNLYGVDSDEDKRPKKRKQKHSDSESESSGEKRVKKKKKSKHKGLESEEVSEKKEKRKKKKLKDRLVEVDESNKAPGVSSSDDSQSKNKSGKKSKISVQKLKKKHKGTAD